MNAKKTLKELGVKLDDFKGRDIEVYSPIDGSHLASIHADDHQTADEKIAKSVTAFEKWRDVPAPKRGEIIRCFGNELRENKENLAELVTMECGKILQEGLGEVQEMIDICDFAVGLSRRIGGLTLPSERPMHVMHENWLPLGPVGIISAFNFPVAVWAWNTAIAIICGDSVIWKPSEKTPLTALACQAVFQNALKKSGMEEHKDISQVVLGFANIGEQIVNDSRIPLISATGSSAMGKVVGQHAASRMGKSILELGGNNAVIVTPSADFDVALPSILFGAVGTAGQRCTSTRRVFVHNDIYNKFFEKLRVAYSGLPKKVGNPLKDGTLIGPLIDEEAFNNIQNSLNIVRNYKDAKIVGGKRILEKKFPNAYYVEPALVMIKEQEDIVKKETFAPILYVMPFDDLCGAIKMQNDVPQGLSSAIFTNDLREAEIFKQYSDCGIANVNIGTSGAEIGGAFGGEKETGGGRESGSDSWKAYMRRQTSTTYYGQEAPQLAQGIKFG
ncbi:MAG: aldehyde dehydrogenase family protein [Alphaproteobacteria bacterium CG11_big_fil_rev_8_21_14_0_20_39_49]|nr:MAG: aldehyde dehydrogenase family protein [Alphaproteobacteria bacterium CG11_big_fil_rev_8_21_14_0_20_39_49]